MEETVVNIQGLNLVQHSRLQENCGLTLGENEYEGDYKID